MLPSLSTLSIYLLACCCWWAGILCVCDIRIYICEPIFYIWRVYARVLVPPNLYIHTYICICICVCVCRACCRIPYMYVYV